MSKYDNYYKDAYSDMDYDEQLQLELELQQGESILWQGKPKKSARVYNSIFAPILPFVLIWLFFDGAIIGGMVVSGAIKDMAFFIIPFFALHLMPVWIWLGGIIKAMGKNKYNHYVITDRRVLIKSDSVLYNSIYHTEIVNVSVKRSLADRMAGSGDICIAIQGMGRENILDIEEYEQVCMMLQEKILELRRAGHVPQYRTNVCNNNVFQGNFVNSNMSAFAEGGQYSNTQYVENGEFVQNPNMPNGMNDVYCEYTDANNGGYNNQNY